MTATPRTVEQTNFDAIAGIYDCGLPAAYHRALPAAARQLRACATLPHGVSPRSTSGPGRVCWRSGCSDLGLGVVALDPFPQMLGQLRQRRPDIETVVAHGDDIPFPDDVFDLTYSVAVMHHIAEPSQVRRTLSEMVRVTRPGGRILVWDHNPLNPYWSLLMRRVPQDTGAERLVPLPELVAGLRDAGADIVRTERLGLMPEFVPRWLLDPAAAVERMVEATPGLRRFCAHNVVLAIKT